MIPESSPPAPNSPAFKRSNLATSLGPLMHQLTLRIAALALCCSALATFSQHAKAQEASVSAAVVAERVRALNPGTHVDSVAASPIAGLYEVVMGKNVAYVEASGRYALFGHVWDMQERRDLTADRKAALDKVDTALLPRDLAVRHVRGKGTRVLYSFADPQCGYCKQLEQAIQELDDVTVYTFVMPLLGPDSKRLAVAVACAADPAAAWSNLMLKAQIPTTAPADAAAACAAKVDAVATLGQKLGITGTPTLIAADGRKTAGAMPAAQLSAWLGEVRSAQGVRTGPAVAVMAAPATRPDAATTARASAKTLAR